MVGIPAALGQDARLVAAIICNDDNFSYGFTVSVHLGAANTIATLTDDRLE